MKRVLREPLIQDFLYRSLRKQIHWNLALTEAYVNQNDWNLFLTEGYVYENE